MSRETLYGFINHGEPFVDLFLVSELLNPLEDLADVVEVLLLELLDLLLVQLPLDLLGYVAHPLINLLLHAAHLLEGRVETSRVYLRL